MGTIREKLAYLNNTKSLIRNAIIDKGVAVSATDTFRSYAEKIGLIQGGGSSGSSLNLGPYAEPVWNYSFSNPTSTYPTMSADFDKPEFVYPEDWWDIEAILDADEENYPAKMIVLYPNDVPTTTLYGANFYRTSDGTTYTADSLTTSQTHTWDRAHDKIGSEGLGYRYVISYFSAANGVRYMQSRYNTMNSNAIAVVTKGFRWQQATTSTSSSYSSYMPFYNKDRLQYIKTKDSDWSDCGFMYYWCAGCLSLRYVELDFNNGISRQEAPYDLRYMFSECRNLNHVKMSIPARATALDCMFQYCTDLRYVDIDWTYKDYGVVCNTNYMFSNCSGLQNATIIYDNVRDTFANPWIMFVSNDPLKVSSIEFQAARDSSSSSSYGDYSTQYPQRRIIVEASNDGRTWTEMGEICPKLWTQLATDSTDIDPTNAYTHWKFTSVDRINSYFTAQHIAFTAQYEKTTIAEDGTETKEWVDWAQPNFSSANQDNCYIIASGESSNEHAYYAFNTSTSVNNCWRSNDLSTSARAINNQYMFYSGVTNLNTIYIEGGAKITWQDCRFIGGRYVIFENTDSITTFASSFAGISSNATSPLLGCIIPNTSNVTNWGKAFMYCTNMTVAPQITFTDKVTNVDQMFSYTVLQDITHLDVTNLVHGHGLLRDITSSGFTRANLTFPNALELSCLFYNNSIVQHVNVVAPKCVTLSQAFQGTGALEYARVTGYNLEENATRWVSWSRPNLTSNTSYGEVTKDDSLSIVDSGSQLYYMYDNTVNTNNSFGSNSGQVRFAGTGSIYWTLPETLKLRIKVINFISGFSRNLDGGFKGRFYADADKTIPLTDEFETDGSVWKTFSIPVTAAETVYPSAIVLDITENTYASIGEIRFDAEYETSGYMTNLSNAFRESSVSSVVLDASKVTTMSYAFYNSWSSGAKGMPNLLDIPDIGYDSVTDMSYAFRGQKNLTELNSIEFPVATNMNYAFQYCEGLISIDDLSVPEAISMDCTFQYCSSLASVQQPDWPKVQSMSHAFANCAYLKDLDLSNLPAVTNCSYICSDNSRLAKAKLPATSTKTDLNHAFYYCSNLRQITLGDVSNVTDASDMCQNCSKLVSVSDLALNSCTNALNMFYQCYWLETITVTNLDAVTNASYMFYNCNRLTSLTLPDMPNVTTLSRAFQSCGALVSLTLGATPVCTDMSYLCTSNVALVDLSLEDTSAVTNFSYAFQRCDSLETVTIPSTTACTDFSYMFDMYTGDANYAPSKLKTVSVLDTSNGTNFAALFRWCTLLQSSPVPSITSKARNLDSMFEMCKSITDWSFIDDYDVSQVDEMTYMFARNNFTTFSIANWDWPDYCNKTRLFSYCPELTTLTLDFKNRTVGCNSNSGDYDNSGHDYMFAACPKLTTLNLLNTSGFRDFNYFFANTYFENITFNFGDYSSNGWYHKYMFYNCPNLKSVTLNYANRGFSTNYAGAYNVNSYAFASCPKLTSITLVGVNNCQNWDSVFRGMTISEDCTVDWSGCTIAGSDYHPACTYMMQDTACGGNLKHINLNAVESNPAYYAFNGNQAAGYIAEPMYQEAQIDLDLPVEIQVSKLSFIQRDGDEDNSYRFPNTARFYTDSACQNPLTPAMILETVANSATEIDVANVVTDHITCKFGQENGHYIGAGQIEIDAKVKGIIEYKPWTQPVLSSNTSYGTVTYSSTSNNGWGWRAFDGKTTEDTWAGWYTNDSSNTGWLQWELPNKLRIKKITVVSCYYNSSSYCNFDGRFYTDSTKTTPIGDAFSFNSWNQTKTVSGIPPEGIETKYIYLNKTGRARYSGVQEIRIEADEKIVTYLPWSTPEETWTEEEDWKQPVPVSDSGTGDSVRTVTASGFSSNDWIRFPEAFNPAGTWEMVWKWNCSNTSISNGTQLAGVKDTYSFVIGVQNSRPVYWFSSNGTSWDLASGVEVPLPSGIASNKDYWYRLSWDGSETKFEISDNGTNYQGVVTVAEKLHFDDSTYLYLSGLRSSSNSPWQGSIELSACYVKDGSDYFWTYENASSIEKVGNPTISDITVELPNSGTFSASSNSTDHEAYKAAQKTGSSWISAETDAAPYWQWQLPNTVHASNVSFESDSIATCQLYSDDGQTELGDVLSQKEFVSASNFSGDSDRFLIINSNQAPTITSSLTAIVKFYSTSPSTYGQTLLWTELDQGFYIGSAAKLAMWRGDSGEIGGTTTISANTWYWAYYTLNSELCTAYLLADPNQIYSVNSLPELDAWTQEFSFALAGTDTTLEKLSHAWSAGSKNSSWSANNNEYLQGSIDLSNTRIYVDDELWWNPLAENSYTNNGATISESYTGFHKNLAELATDISTIRIKPLTRLDGGTFGTDSATASISNFLIEGTYDVQKSNVLDFEMPVLKSNSQEGYEVAATPARKTIYNGRDSSYQASYMYYNTRMREIYVPAFFSNISYARYMFQTNSSYFSDQELPVAIHDLDFYGPTYYSSTTRGYVNEWFSRSGDANRRPSVFVNPRNIVDSINLSSLSLTHDSLVALLNALVSRMGETASTLTLGATNLAQLTDEEKAVATAKNWNLA